jgi:archaeal type IV pilus assembly protein PilA
MKFSDDGVSPVIGVIFMIAITVILAAAIAFFIFGQISPAPPHEKNVVATASQIGDNLIVVTYLGGPDQNDCTTIKITITPEIGQIQNQIIQPASGAVMPGSRLSFNGAFTGKDRVQVSAGFRGGSEKTIYDSSL